MYRKVGLVLSHGLHRPGRNTRSKDRVPAKVSLEPSRQETENTEAFHKFVS